MKTITNLVSIQFHIQVSGKYLRILGATLFDVCSARCTDSSESSSSKKSAIGILPRLITLLAWIDEKVIGILAKFQK